MLFALWKTFCSGHSLEFFIAKDFYEMTDIILNDEISPFVNRIHVVELYIP